MKTYVKSVSKHFGQTEALKSLNLTIESGEFVAILGPSGCGKTTLLRLLAGFEEPTAGEITMGEEVVAAKGKVVPPEQRNLGMVFQSFALWPHMTVAQQILFPLAHHRFVATGVKKEKEKHVQEMLEMVGLAEYGHRYPGELSGGQKQRVAIARALAPQPGLLLMDEPLSSLDAELRVELRKEIQTIHRKTNAAIVYVTHDQSEALAMADRIIVMQNGEIEQIGTAEEIYLKPATAFVATFVSKANLVPGKWREDTFIPLGQSNIQWKSSDVHPSFEEQGQLPVRPEQFQLSSEQGALDLEGQIENILFQGKDVLYVVRCKDQVWNIIEQLPVAYKLNDKVFISYK